MSDDRHLMRLHIAALFTHDDRGRLLRVNEPGGGPAPRFFLGRTTQGRDWRIRDDVNDDLAAELESACAEDSTADEMLTPPRFPTPYEAILGRASPVQHISAGPAFHCQTDLAAGASAVLVTDANASILRRYLSAWLGDIATAQPMFAFMVDGDAVSLCASVRITAAAHEAGVETTPDYRGHGCAVAVVAAWANAVRRVGAVPLYSTSWQNVASQAVARKLGWRLFGTDLHFT